MPSLYYYSSVMLSMCYVVSENRAGPSNIGNVISQILLCKQIAPDFNQEEICSIAKDSQELTRIMQEIQEFLPQQDTSAGKFYLLIFRNILHSITYFRINKEIVSHSLVVINPLYSASYPKISSCVYEIWAMLH